MDVTSYKTRKTGHPLSPPHPPTSAASGPGKMRIRILPNPREDVSLGEQDPDLCVRPVLRRERLEVHDDALFVRERKAVSRDGKRGGGLGQERKEGREGKVRVGMIVPESLASEGSTTI
jgi:hypothetical protein